MNDSAERGETSLVGGVSVRAWIALMLVAFACLDSLAALGLVFYCIEKEIEIPNILLIILSAFLSGFTSAAGFYLGQKR